MGKLDQVETGLKIKPLFIIIYGEPGVGKTTLANQFQNKVFIGTENPVQFDTPRLIDKSYTGFLGTLNALTNDEHDYKTVIVDSIDGVEGLCEKQILAEGRNPKATLATFEGGYGKGVARLRVDMFQLMQKFKALVDKGINVVLVGHSIVEEVKDPESGDRTRHALNLNKKIVNDYVKEVDMVLYLREDILKASDGSSTSTGRRKILTEGSATYNAKTRFPLPREIEMKNDTIPQILQQIKKHFIKEEK